MRWIWIDRFTEFTHGERAVALKNVSLSEDHMHDHFPGDAVMPASLMIEGMAQTGGILLGELNDFAHLVILAKVPKVRFHRRVVPGDTLRYEAVLQNATEQGGTVEVTATVGGELAAEAEILFAHLSPDDPDFAGADQRNFVFTTNLLQVMDVGKA